MFGCWQQPQKTVLMSMAEQEELGTIQNTAPRRPCE